MALESSTVEAKKTTRPTPLKKSKNFGVVKITDYY